MTTPADNEALAIMANAENQEYLLAAQRFDVLQGTRSFAVSSAEGADLMNITQELYSRWHNMMAMEDSISSAQTARYAVIADMIVEARKQHALQQANVPLAQPVVAPSVN